MEAMILANAAKKMNLTPQQATFLPTVAEKLSRDFGMSKWNAVREIAYNDGLRDYIASVLKTLA